jgi:excinuclease ABC subunit A
MGGHRQHQPESTALRVNVGIKSMPALIAQPRSIELHGVRTHNLRSIDLDLPLGKLIVVTGVSGAGKSSLALDTLYAEGQRRYVETFSPYTRQFLAKLDKPDADRIEGIPPAIAPGQPQGRQSGRSTVGTITEIHDALCLLYTRAGEVICRTCGHRVEPASPASVALAIEAWPDGTRYEVAFPVEIRPETDRAALTRSLAALGFTRLRVNGAIILLDDPGLALPDSGAVDVVVDRLVRGKDPAQRRADSIETAFEKGMGRCRVCVGDVVVTYIRGWRCAHCGTDHIEPQPNLFRYNSPLGACPVCEGLGRTIELDLSRIVPDRSRTIRQGALAPWSAPVYQGYLQGLLENARELGIPLNVPFEQLTGDHVQRLLDGAPEKGFGGLKGFFGDLERRSHRSKVRFFLARWRRDQPCPGCHGARLRPEALAVKIEGRDIAALSGLTIRDARRFFDGLASQRRQPGALSILAQIDNRLGYLAEIGLDYLTLDRPMPTLSAGEFQRVGLTKILGSGLVNTLYVLDEPTLGLHPSDVARLIVTLKHLRDLGNTLVVVEHDQDVILSADYLVDLGPGAGAAGGQVVYSGPVSGLTAALGSATGDFLAGRKRAVVAGARRIVKQPSIRLVGARGNNLKSLDVTFPLGLLTVVTGVSGSGKTTLVEETLYPALRRHLARESGPAAPYDELIVSGDVADAVFLDQSLLSRLARSNPATHLKAFDEIRKTFAATHEARLRNYDAGRFSFNVDGGRCNACQGRGFLSIDMQFLPDVMVRCPECKGTRYRPEILEVAYRGKNIAEVLDLTGREAFSFFRNRPKVQARLRPMLDIGLDYLTLGQPVSTLSGGEAQRLKLAGFLARSTAALKRPGAAPHTVFLLDEPTAGLHPLDVVKLLETLNALIDRGHSVIVIEHSVELMLAADWIIDLGPGAGDDGGQVVAQGTPEDVTASATLTGQVLASRGSTPR